jgi:CheY-like chemotaxis protein
MPPPLHRAPARRQAHRVQVLGAMSAIPLAMNPPLPLRAPTRLDNCVHDARNALAAISAATEVLERSDAPPPVLHKAGAVVARQARELAQRMGELMTHARHGSAQSERALVVSDDIHLLARIAGLLSHAGYQIDLAVSTVSGYEMLLREQPDFAVIDLRTSAGEARSLARLARGAGFDGRLIAIEDAVSTRGLPPTSSAAGFDAVLARAFELKVLHAAIPLD